MNSSSRRWIMGLVGISLAASVGIYGYLRQDRPSVEGVRAAYEAGRYADAERMANQLPADGAVLKLRLLSAARQRRIAAAVAAYQELERLRAADEQSRQELARASAEDLAASRSPEVAVQACSLAPRGDGPCLDRLREIEASAATPPPIALAAAKAIGGDLSARERAVRDGFEALLPRNPTAAAESTRALPPATALPLLRRVAEIADAQGQYVAATMMGELGDAAAAATLKGLVATGASRSAQWAARIALARLGDAEQVQALVENRQWIGGADLLRAGIALDRAGRPEGVDALRTLARGDDQILRVEAAAALHARDSQFSESVLETGYASANPWTRARALEAAADLRLPIAASAAALLTDENDFVRLAATRALNADTQSR